MNRRCDFHFELEIPTNMISWEPSAKIIAENLVSAKSKIMSFLIFLPHFKFWFHVFSIEFLLWS